MSSSNGGTSEELHAQATKVLSQRLVNFRNWLKGVDGAHVHSSVCVVNGDATDGTKNAPVLTLGSPYLGATASSSQSLSTHNNGEATSDEGGASEGSKLRLGSIEGSGQESLYARTMGCQVRAVREIKKGDTAMTIPRCGMITPDLVASSDAGRALLACVEAASDESNSPTHFWDAFGNTTELSNSFQSKIAHNSGTQLLVKILRQRADAEKAFKERQEKNNDGKNTVKLVQRGAISTRAPLLAFMIHQRFHENSNNSNGNTPVVSTSKQSEEQFQSLLDGNDDDNSRHALQNSTPVDTPPNAPDSFSPYILTWPSSVLIPLCWTRSELALMNGCIPGNAVLQEVALSTIQLSTEFQSLIGAGILERFPETFPPGLITFDRWIWAASIVASRALPATIYFDDSDKDSTTFAPQNSKEFQSPGEIWDELGVMVPLLDMLNHEINTHQVKWEPTVAEARGKEASHGPRAILEKKVKKGNEIFTAYGDVTNHHLICQYGMAQVNNEKDEVRIGWGLSESVGRATIPTEFEAPVSMEEAPSIFHVYESTDSTLVDQWWTDDRMKLLKHEALYSSGSEEAETMAANLKQGRKLSLFVYNDGSLNPTLLSAIVVATLPPSQVATAAKLIPEDGSSGDDNNRSFAIKLQHQKSLRNTLSFFFARKLEKLLVNLNGGLKAHYTNCSLWTSASKSGLAYKRDGGEKVGDTSMDEAEDTVGWSSFFDMNGFGSIMEVEKDAYYAMAPDSCVLTLYDGQLRALQRSLNLVTNEETFNKDVVGQLESLGYYFDDEPMDVESTEADSKTTSNDEGGKHDSSAKGKDKSENGGKDDNASTSEEKKTSPGRKRRNRKKKDASAAPGGAGPSNDRTDSNRRPALKLHVGNLAYSTTPSDLYDFFSALYGKDNILECHIPLERETGRSRGFGFVTMPEAIAQKALTSGRKHEIAGRLLKVARSNSAGTSDSARAIPPGGYSSQSKDRCATCGYRPRYCVCPDFIPTDGRAGAMGKSHHGGPPPPRDRMGHRGSLDPGNGNGGHPPLDWRAEEMRSRGDGPPPRMRDPSPPRMRDHNGGGDDRYRRRDDRYMEDRYGRPRGYEDRFGGRFDDYGRGDRRDYDRFGSYGDDHERRTSYSYDSGREQRRDHDRRLSRRHSRDRSVDSPSPSRSRSDKNDSYHQRDRDWDRDRDRPRRRGSGGDRYERERDRDRDRDRQGSKRSRSPRSSSRSPERSHIKKSRKRESG